MALAIGVLLAIAAGLFAGGVGASAGILALEVAAGAAFVVLAA